MGRFNWIPTKNEGLVPKSGGRVHIFYGFCGSWKANVLMSVFFELTFFGLSRLKHTLKQHQMVNQCTSTSGWCCHHEADTLDFSLSGLPKQNHCDINPSPVLKLPPDLRPWHPPEVLTHRFLRWTIEGWSWSNFPYFSLCEVAWGCSASDQHSGGYDILAALKISQSILI